MHSVFHIGIEKFEKNRLEFRLMEVWKLRNTPRTVIVYTIQRKWLIEREVGLEKHDMYIFQMIQVIMLVGVNLNCIENEWILLWNQNCWKLL